MKKVFSLLAFLIALTCHAQVPNPQYNKALADSLGADDYGMKAYVLAILKTGPIKIENKQTIDSLFADHMQNINRLAALGKLVVAGPLKKNEKMYRGIFILNVKTVEEASVLINTDPAIKEKLLEADLFVWYGSAALPLYLKHHDMIEKHKP